MKWLKEDLTHRFAEFVGMQHSFNTELNAIEDLKKKVLYYKVKEELMGKYRKLISGWNRPFLKAGRLFEE